MEWYNKLYVEQVSVNYNLIFFIPLENTNLSVFGVSALMTMIFIMLNHS